MKWFKDHADSVVTIVTILGTVVWMNGKFTDIDHRFSNLEKDVAIIKTVMIMKEILPRELAIVESP